MNELTSAVVNPSSDSIADAALARMAGKLSHQFNNLLAVIKGNVTFLREMGGCSADMEDVLADIESATESAIEMTGRLQRFAGHTMSRPERVDLRTLVEETIVRLEDEYPDVVFHALLPYRPCIVELDIGHAQGAILEMARNAVAALSRNIWIELSVPPSERASGAPRQRTVLLQTRDDGQGMTAEILERANEPLFTTRNENRAAGWGLSMVAGFVRQSEGRMKITSAPGSGTQVTICLPTV